MIIVDASVAVTILSREQGASRALQRLATEQHRLAPDWIRLEVANAMARKVRENLIARSDAQAAANAVTVLVSEQVDSFELLDEAFALSVQVKHPMYDCLYLALGLRHGAVVLTADKQFVERAGASGFEAAVELLA